LKPAGVGELGRHYPLDVGEAGEIHSVEDVAPLPKARPSLLPGEEDVSVPDQQFPRDPVLLMVNRVLGERLTTDNPAWRGDPVPVMRSLQKMLVAHSLTLAEAEREPAMDAIRAVELAVRWRLRWMQMRRSEAESHFIQPQQEDHATQKNA
jgi:hypothetical protein